MIKFIYKILKFIFTLFISLIIFTYIFSLKSDMSFENTIEYFKTIGANFLNMPNSQNVTVNTNPDNMTVIISNNNYYYYKQLDKFAQVIYSALENNIDNLKEDNYVIDFSTQFNELLNTPTGTYKLNSAFQSALDAFFYDHPELFYLDLSKFSLNTKCISIGSLKTYTVKIVPKHTNYLHSSFNNKHEVDIAISKVETLSSSLINTALKYTDPYKKIKYIHDWLVNSIDYELSANNVHNIYGALIEKKVVCEGYAKTFKYIMDNLNIECILVSGIATNSSGENEAHMWNYVKLNDKWYGVDVTWDDPIIIGGYIKDNLRHDYFLKGRRAFLSSHNSTGKISDTGMLFTIPNLSNNNYR